MSEIQETSEARPRHLWAPWINAILVGGILTGLQFCPYYKARLHSGWGFPLCAREKVWLVAPPGDIEWHAFGVVADIAFVVLAMLVTWFVSRRVCQPRKFPQAR